MSSGLRLGGLSSGLDTEAIVSQLMAIERQPRARLERKQAAVQARQDALRDISTKLKALKSAAQGIASAGTWAPTQTITSSDPTRVGARVAGSDAQFKVNGTSYTRGSNTVTDAVAGMEMTLNGLTTTPVKVEVGVPTV